MRIQFDLDEESRKRLEYLRESMGVATISEVYGRALRLLELANEKQDSRMTEKIATENVQWIAKPHLFLCHSHRDKRFVRKLARVLSELCIDVWFDEWELRAGDSLHGCIGSALRISSFVGIVLSPDSVKSHWCQDELREALSREKKTGKKVVIPLLHKIVEVPPFLEDRLYLDFRRDHFPSAAQLAAIIHGIDQRFVAEELSHKQPKTLEEVRAVLRSCGWDNTKFVAASNFDRIREILRRSGIPLSGNTFDILYEERGNTRATRAHVAR
jgi:hypothetical protein